MSPFVVLWNTQKQHPTAGSDEYSRGGLLNVVVNSRVLPWPSDPVVVDGFSHRRLSFLQ